MFCIRAAVVLLCCFAAIQKSAAIFEEQLGEFDWKKEHVGYIERSLVVGSNLVVVSEDSVLASLNQDTGALKWRVVLPKSTEILKIVDAEGQLVTLTSQQQGGSAVIVTVRGWSAADGALLWDVQLGSSNLQSDGSDRAEMMYVAASRQLTVLHGNALHVVSVPLPNSGVAPTYFTWSATADLAAAQVRAGSAVPADSTLVLSSLVAPTYVAGDGKSAAAGKAGAEVRTAVGCFRSALSQDGLCGEAAAVITLAVPREGSNSALTASLDTFSLALDGHAVAPAALTASLSSDASAAYQWNDLMFATTAAGMAVLSLAPGSAGASLVAYPPGATSAFGGDAAATPRSFLYVTADGELRPAGAVCGAGICSAVTLNTKGASAQDWVLEPLTSCGGASKQWSALQLTDYPFHDRVVRAVQCVEATLEQGVLSGMRVGSVALDTSALGIVAAPFVSQRMRPSAQLLFDAHAVSPIRHVAVLPEKGKAAACAAVRVLVVLQSGEALALRSEGCRDTRPVEALWVRQEALARAKQAVVLSKVDSDAERLTELAIGGHSMPGLPERLRLQGAKLQGYVTKGVGAAQKLVAQLQAAVADVSAMVAQGAGLRRPRLQRIAERDLGKLQMFGFDKTAVLLCYSDDLARQLSAGTAERTVPFSRAGLQLVFVELLRSSAQQSEQKSLYLSLQGSAAAAAGQADPVVAYVKLLAGPAPARRLEGFETSAHPAEDSSSAGATVVVGTTDGRTFVWTVDAAGKAVQAGARQCGAQQQQQQQQQQRADGTCGGKGVAGALLPVAASLTGAADSSLVAVATASSVLGAVTVPAFSLLHETAQGAASLTLLAVPAVDSELAAGARLTLPSAYYTHSVDAAAGKIAIYAASTAAGACTASQLQAQAGLLFSCLPLREVASMTFDPAEERVVDVTYPSAQDAIHVRHSILGDDSVLVKYLNPHVVLVTTVSAGQGRAASADAGEEQAGDSDAAGTGAVLAAADGVMHWTLVDTVTGRVVLRLHQEGGSLPVHSILVENHIVSTYWNARAKRTELSSTALYDGVIDNTELTPFASSRARSNSAYLSSLAASAGAAAKSAYTAASPIAMQKTYVLPRAVTALQHTVTAHGLSNKNVLMAMQNGQIYSVDMKQIHPRRPFSDPSTAEKSEGLVRYSPFVTLMPLSALTHNYSLPGGAQQIVSSPSLLESSSLVLSFGGSVDVHLNRVMPSQDFDLLSSDFNYHLLVAILSGLASTVLFLRNMQQQKHLHTIWA